MVGDERGMRVKERDIFIVYALSEVSKERCLFHPFK